jgi:hypothetical protein
MSGMTDRHMGYIVSLGEDVREDDAEAIINALRMVKGVLAVEPVVADSMAHVVRMRVEDEVRGKLIDLVRSIR